jgi:hypothetical protein
MTDEARPPFVRFEVRAIEDRNATVDAGHYVGKDVIFAIVTPVGSRDTLEKVAEDWLAGIAEGVKQERIPQNWLHEYTRAFENFKEGRNDPLEGTPISSCAFVSPAQAKTLLDINCRTVEQLAEANEETVMRIGMGGRALKHKAIAWLESANETGKVAEELASLRQRNEELELRDKEREKELKELQSEVKALTKAAKETA